MIITNKNLVFLDNPKCGSSTMRQKYYGQLSKIFQGFKNITDVNSNYSNYNYVHCNLEAAIIYIESVMKKDPNDFKFITTIRDPYTRVLSGLNHRHTRDNCCADDLWDYVKPGFGFSNFNSNKFRTFNEYKISYLIKVENLHQDVKLISDKYDLGLKIPINTISNKKSIKSSLSSLMK